jgi:acyl-[acyl-carrier-protein]-phospholipid O-acyltransferase / long-chain-fatty-acid--[acyl-carrier-protein] ligase
MTSIQNIKTDRSFAWLNGTQFLGALNDNIFKLLIAFCLIQITGEENTSSVMAISGAVFVIPFLLFSHAGGILADRFSKRNIVVLTKCIEIVAMLLGAVAFLSKEPFLLYSTLFLMATQSAIFGPSKYGIIPELVKKTQLSKANSLITSFTYLAIIIGTPAAGFLSGVFKTNFTGPAIFCVFIAITGTVFSTKIRKTPALGSGDKFTLGFLKDLWNTTIEIKKDRYLFLSVMGTAYFMLIGFYIQLNIIPFGMEHLSLLKEQSSNLFLMSALGIGFGSFLSGKMSGRNIEFGVVPLGALFITFSSMLLYLLSPGTGMSLLLLFIMGTGAGLFIVPLESFVQFQAPEKHRGKILATKNFLGFFSVLISAGMMFILHSLLGFTPAQGFFFVGLLTLALTIITLIILPDFFLRFFLVTVIRFCYRIKIRGEENIPVEGPALLICNHVSWIDALLLMATQQRRIRFLMYREIYDKPFLTPIMRLGGVIPISYNDPPKEILKSLKQARHSLDEGYMVCVFAEGSITRSGKMMAFRKGFERIVRKSNYPIIPIYLGGAWGSILSYYHGKICSKLPSLIPYKISILFGKAMPPTSTAFEVKSAVQELASESYEMKKSDRKSLASYFIKTARKNWFRKAVNDTTGKKLSYGKTLLASLALAKYLEEECKDQKMVGIILPASVGGALCNIAVTLLGKIPVNLNFTSSRDAFNHSINQCEIKTCLSSRVFISKLKDFKVPEGTIFLEDIMTIVKRSIGFTDLMKAMFFPAKMLIKGKKIQADDIATVIFSSGTTGKPKGVMLSHHNIISNIESFRMIFNTSPKDNVCGSLPFFHSFGYTVTIWFPLLSGFSASYHPNPLDGAMIAKVVRENKSNILLATPTFLLSYIRKAKVEDFKTLKYAVTGAEKLRQKVAEKFNEKFGIIPLEGYGTTELSPVVSFNFPDVEIDGVHQVGIKIDSVGHPNPGVTVKVLDPDTGERLPPGESGLLFVKGPNVMLGYLGEPEKTAEVIKDGWYNTGDIAVLDEDGFITITDRLSRFSKIGGEMIPHLAIEEKLLTEINKLEKVIAVTSLPDEKKGEKLIVLFTKEAGGKEKLINIIKKSDLPNLWKPRKENFFEVEEIPLLGTGKINLKGLKILAAEIEGRG